MGAPVQLDDDGIVQYPFHPETAIVLDDEVVDENAALDAFDDLFPWTPDVMNLDMLPPTIFDEHSELFPAQLAQVMMQGPSSPKSRFAQFSSRLPTLDDINNLVHDAADSDKQPCTLPTAENTTHEPTCASPWSLTHATYTHLVAQALDFSAVLPPGLALPGQNVLIRCLEKYMRCGAEFLPIVHFARFRARDKPVELVLAMAALGGRNGHAAREQRVASVECDW